MLRIVKERDIDLIGYLAIAIPILTFAFIGISILLANKWFVWTQYALSNLGASVDSRVVFNTGLMVIGTLVALLGILLLSLYHNKGIFFILGSLIIASSGVALFGIGLSPMDTTP